MNRQGKFAFQLPAAEDDLWHQVVVRLLEQRDSDEEQARDHLRLLEELAFHHRFCDKPLTRAFVEDTATWLAKERDFGSPRDKAQEWLADLERWELLLRNDDAYEFAIPTLDEYFAARHLAARWAERIQEYERWLPCADGWWRRPIKLRCLNPYCSNTLPPFRSLLRQPGYQEICLLFLSVIKRPDEEELFLRGIRPLGLLARALSRCWHEHSSIVRAMERRLSRRLLTDILSPTIRDGLAALGGARTDGNVDPILDHWIHELLSGGNKPSWPYVQALACTRHPRAVDAVLKVLTEGQPIVRMEAAYAATFLGSSAVEPLVSALTKDEDERVRERIAHHLGAIGDQRAVQPLLRTVGDTGEDLKVRESAAEALGELGDARAVKPLVVVLKNSWFARESQRSPSSIAIVAISALGKIGDPLAVDPLMAVFNEAKARTLECAWAREAVVRALREIGDVRGLDTLLEVLKEHENPRARREAVLALAQMGAAVLEPVITALKHEDARVRSGAAEALGDIRDTRAVQPLISTLKDQDPEVRQAAIDALGKVGTEDAVEHLIQALEDEAVWVWHHAWWALRHIGDSAAGPLMRALKDKNPWVRRGAAWALAGMLSPEIVTALRKLLKEDDGDGRVRDAVLHVIEGLRVDAGLVVGAADAYAQLTTVIKPSRLAR